MSSSTALDGEAKPSDFYVVLRRSPASRDLWRSARDLSALLFLLFPALIFLATVADGTQVMPAGAKGYLQHHGFWVIFVTTPTLICLAGLVLDRYYDILNKPETYLVRAASEAQIADLRVLASEELNELCLRGRARYVLFFGVVVGLIYFIINVTKTWDPRATYGHDVFDAWAHPIGYFATKIYLLPVFVLVYPVTIFIVFQVSMSAVRLLRHLCTNDVLEMSYFHEDNCGGTSCFGELNLLMMAISTSLFAVLAGMWLTHERTYFVTRSALAFCSAFMILQSVTVVWQIHKFVSAKKRTCLAELTGKLNDDLRSSLVLNAKFRHELLAVRAHVAGIHTFPYATRVAFAVNAMRLAPVAIAVITFVRQ